MNKSVEDNSRDFLEKAFKTFQQQCEMLEASHADLKAKLAAAQLDLQRKNAELANRLLEIEAIRERLAGTLDSITDSVFIVDPDTDSVEPANHAATRLLQSLPLNNRSLLSIDALPRLLHAGRKINDQSIEFRLDGDNHFWLVSVIPMHVKMQDHKFTVVSIKDLTEQKNLETRLAREDRMAALGKVAASVAHEIRNPLSAIEGFAALLERDLADQPNTRRLASKTVYAARQLNAVVGNLLSYTREYHPSLYPCAVSNLIDDSVTLVTPMAEDHGVAINIAMPADPPGVMIDTVMMRQVIANLLTNAIEACPRKAGGRIDITVRTGTGEVNIEIADNGTGIPQDRKKKIFEPFYTAKTGGIGLGLALCTRIIDAHEGRIEENGIPGEGARFQIELKCMEKKNK